MSLPNYTDINDILKQIDSDIDAAELHGVLCGLLCAGDESDGLSWLDKALATPGMVARLDDMGKAMLRTLYAVTFEQLNHQDFDFTLLLPDDELPLKERSQALAFWCHGLTVGIQLGGGYIGMHQNSEASEALTDLSAITRMMPEVTEDEENERSYTEVVEYVRVAVMLIRQERLQKPKEVQIQ